MCDPNPPIPWHRFFVDGLLFINDIWRWKLKIPQLTVIDVSAKLPRSNSFLNRFSFLGTSGDFSSTQVTRLQCFSTLRNIFLRNPFFFCFLDYQVEWISRSVSFTSFSFFFLNHESNHFWIWVFSFALLYSAFFFLLKKKKGF